MTSPGPAQTLTGPEAQPDAQPGVWACAELFIELYSQELPAAAQKNLAEGFARALTQWLQKEDLLEETTCFKVWSPLRIAISLPGVRRYRPAQIVQKKGPATDAPRPVLEAFMAANGLQNLEACQIQKRGAKDYFFLETTKPGQTAEACLPSGIQACLDQMALPKAMRFGSWRFQWTRPLERLVVVLDGKKVPGFFDARDSDHPEQGRLPFQDSVLGRKFQANPPLLRVESMADYISKLREDHVWVDPEEREKIIRNQLESFARTHRLEWKRNDRLLREVACLVETPRVLFEKFCPAHVPEAVLYAVASQHQKYFLFTEKTGQMASYFAAVANRKWESPEHEALVRHGYGRVLRARLADAAFFIQSDKAQSEAQSRRQLENESFLEGLGSQAQRLDRLRHCARYFIGSSPDLEQVLTHWKRALGTDMGRELPQLHGPLDALYSQIEDQKLFDALFEQEEPRHPAAALPRTELGKKLALCDKLDELLGCLYLGKKVTGSSDPLGLRRLGFALVRLVRSLEPLHPVSSGAGSESGLTGLVEANLTAYQNQLAASIPFQSLKEKTLMFLKERLVAELRHRGLPADLIRALRVHERLVDSSGEAARAMVFKKTTLGARFAQRLMQTSLGQSRLRALRRAYHILPADWRTAAWRVRTRPAGQEDATSDPASNADAYGKTERELLTLLERPRSASQKDEKKPNQAPSQDQGPEKAWTSPWHAQEWGEFKKNVRFQLEFFSEICDKLDSFMDETLVFHADERVRNNRLNLLADVVEMVDRLAAFHLIALPDVLP